MLAGSILETKPDMTRQFLLLSDHQFYTRFSVIIILMLSLSYKYLNVAKDGFNGFKNIYIIYN